MKEYQFIYKTSFAQELADINKTKSRQNHINAILAEAANKTNAASA